MCKSGKNAHNHYASIGPTPAHPMRIPVAVPSQSRVDNKVYVVWRYMFCTTRLLRRDWELLMPTPCRHRRPPLGQAAKLPPFCSPSAAVGGACRRAPPSRHAGSDGAHTDGSSGHPASSAFDSAARACRPRLGTPCRRSRPSWPDQERRTWHRCAVCCWCY